MAGWIQGGIMGQEALFYSLASLAVMIGLDWVSGVCASRYEGKPIESAKLARTSDKLIGRAIGVLIVGILFGSVEGAEKWGSVAVTGLIWWYMAVEAWSIVENLDRMKMPLPKWFKKRLKAIMAEEPDASVHETGSISLPVEPTNSVQFRTPGEG